MRRRMLIKFLGRFVFVEAVIVAFVLNIWIASTFAKPSGGSWQVGTGAIDNIGSDVMVTPNQKNSVIHWNSLDTNAGENFIFKNNLGGKAVLNRVVGEGSNFATTFNGNLNAAGMKIFMINPAGIIFGSGASVNATSFVASSLDMSNTDFINAVDNGAALGFEMSGDFGDIKNYGNIVVNDSAYLVGKNVLNAGSIEAGNGLVVMAGVGSGEGKFYLGQPGSNILVEPQFGKLGGEVINDSADNVGAGELVLAAGDVYSSAISGVGDLTAVATDNIRLGGDIDVSGDMEIHSDIKKFDSVIGETWTEGDLRAGGDIKVSGDLILMKEEADQTVSAGGRVTVYDDIYKSTDGDLIVEGEDPELSVDFKRFVSAVENIYIEGEGDIQLGKNVYAGALGWDADRLAGDIGGEFNENGDGYQGEGEESPFDKYPPRPPQGDGIGGVSIISNTGKIYTEGGDTVEVKISGYSDHKNGYGVTDRSVSGVEEAPRAAIVMISDEDVKLGEGSELKAGGRYYEDVDDRGAMALLDVDADINAGTPREKGSGFDMGIYISSDGDTNIELNGKVRLENSDTQTAQGGMVADAIDRITFGSIFEKSLAEGNVGNRLEVVSRITEWLFEAEDFGRLPMPEDVVVPDDGYAYVLRGAGLGNGEITDGRAWVLENPGEDDPDPDPAPLDYPEPLPEREEVYRGLNCEDAMEWLSNEIGGQRVEKYLDWAYVGSTSVRPCQACETAYMAANVLGDIDGEKTAAVARVIGSYIDPTQVPDEGTFDAVNQAIAMNIENDPDFATAKQWLDALDTYVNTLENEMGMELEEVAVLVLDKYTPSAEENPAVVALVASRLGG